MIRRLRDWAIDGVCFFQHSEPVFDRTDGQPVFRCPTCMATWPRLNGADGTFRPELLPRPGAPGTAEWWAAQQRKSAARATYKKYVRRAR